MYLPVCVCPCFEVQVNVVCLGLTLFTFHLKHHRNYLFHQMCYTLLQGIINITAFLGYSASFGAFRLFSCEMEILFFFYYCIVN